MKTVAHKINVNDNLICKKTIVFNNHVFFIKDKSYKIESVHENIIFIYNELKNCSQFRLSVQHLDEFKLKDYFLSVQEQRKLKIKKLKNVHTSS